MTLSSHGGKYTAVTAFLVAIWACLIDKLLISYYWTFRWFITFFVYEQQQCISCFIHLYVYVHSLLKMQLKKLTYWVEIHAAWFQDTWETLDISTIKTQKAHNCAISYCELALYCLHYIEEINCYWIYLSCR